MCPRPSSGSVVKHLMTSSSVFATAHGGLVTRAINTSSRTGSLDARLRITLRRARETGTRLVDQRKREALGSTRTLRDGELAADALREATADTGRVTLYDKSRKLLVNRQRGGEERKRTIARRVSGETRELGVLCLRVLTVLQLEAARA